MATVDLRFKCGQCNGTGRIPIWVNGHVTGYERCPMCTGSGKMLIGELDVTDIEDKMNDIYDKCKDIKEKCDEILDKVK